MPNGLAGMNGFNQQGAFQNSMPNYQTSLFGSGNSGSRFPAYLGLGQSLSTATAAFPASSAYGGGFPAATNYGSSIYSYGRSQIGSGR